MTHKLAIFDLDNTLLAGDSDHAWGEFLIYKGIVDKELYEKKNQQFYEDYKQGCLNINEFLAFSLKPLADNDLEHLLALREEFIENVIEDIILPQGEALIADHKEQGHIPLIITATNTFVTEPIATKLGIEHLIGTEPEIMNEKYTGAVKGTPSFHEGKITRLHEWLSKQSINSYYSYFYSDSHNDIPLLSIVDEPIAVDPDDKLRQYADAQSWDIISLRQ